MCKKLANRPSSHNNVKSMPFGTTNNEVYKLLSLTVSALVWSGVVWSGEEVLVRLFYYDILAPST